MQKILIALGEVILAVVIVCTLILGKSSTSMETKSGEINSKMATQIDTVIKKDW